MILYGLDDKFVNYKTLISIYDVLFKREKNRDSRYLNYTTHQFLFVKLFSNIFY
jgi:hypothetical protein